MKIRSGFVSNSSSSSFTCNVCGETQSGMDMSRREAGMFECENGHTLCESHQRSVELTDEEKRAFLVERIQKSSWRTAEDKVKAFAEINALVDAEIEDNYDEAARDDGYPAIFCPICSFEKLDDNDGLGYLLKKSGQTREQLAAVMGAEFKSYRNFVNYIHPPKA